MVKNYGLRELSLRYAEAGGCLHMNKSQIKRRGGGGVGSTSHMGRSTQRHIVHEKYIR